MAEEVAQDLLSARDVIQIADPMLTDEVVDEKRGEFIAGVRGDRASSTGACCSAGRNCMAIPRGMKPKQYRRQLWELGRLVVRTSRLVPRARIPDPP